MNFNTFLKIIALLLFIAISVKIISKIFSCKKTSNENNKIFSTLKENVISANLIDGGKYLIGTSDSLSTNLYIGNTSPPYLKVSSKPSIYTLVKNSNSTYSFKNSNGLIAIWTNSGLVRGDEVLDRGSTTVDKFGKTYNVKDFIIMQNEDKTYSISPLGNTNLFFTTTNADGYGTRLYPKTETMYNGMNQKYIFTISSKFYNPPTYQSIFKIENTTLLNSKINSLINKFSPIYVLDPDERYYPAPLDTFAKCTQLYKQIKKPESVVPYKTQLLNGVYDLLTLGNDKNFSTNNSYKIIDGKLTMKRNKEYFVSVVQNPNTVNYGSTLSAQEAQIKNDIINNYAYIAGDLNNPYFEQKERTSYHLGSPGCPANWSSGNYNCADLASEILKKNSEIDWSPNPQFCSILTKKVFQNEKDTDILVTDFIYHTYFMFNGSLPILPGIGTHMMDIETIVVRFKTSDLQTNPDTAMPFRYYLSIHGGGSWYLPEKLMFRKLADSVAYGRNTSEKTHPIIYLAREGHEAYTRIKTEDTIRGFGIANDTIEGGVCWQPPAMFLDIPQDQNTYNIKLNENIDKDGILNINKNSYFETFVSKTLPSDLNNVSDFFANFINDTSNLSYNSKKGTIDIDSIIQNKFFGFGLPWLYYVGRRSPVSSQGTHIYDYAKLRGFEEGSCTAKDSNYCSYLAAFPSMPFGTLTPNAAKPIMDSEIWDENNLWYKPDKVFCDEKRYLTTTALGGCQTQIKLSRIDYIYAITDIQTINAKDVESFMSLNNNSNKVPGKDDRWVLVPKTDSTSVLATYPNAAYGSYPPQDTNKDIGGPTIYIMVKYQRVSTSSDTKVLTSLVIDHFGGKNPTCPNNVIRQYNRKADDKDLIAGHGGTKGSCWYMGGCAYFTPINKTDKIIGPITLKNNLLTDREYKYEDNELRTKLGVPHVKIKLDQFISSLDLHTACGDYINKSIMSQYIVFGNVDLLQPLINPSFKTQKVPFIYAITDIKTISSSDWGNNPILRDQGWVVVPESETNKTTQATYPDCTVAIFPPQDTNQGIGGPTIYIMVKYERVSTSSATPVLEKISVRHFTGKVSTCNNDLFFNVSIKKNYPYSTVKTIESYNISSYISLLSGHPGTDGSCWYIGGCAVFTPIDKAKTVVGSLTITSSKNDSWIEGKYFVYDEPKYYIKTQYTSMLNQLPNIIDLHSKCGDSLALYLVYGLSSLSSYNNYAITDIKTISKSYWNKNLINEGWVLVPRSDKEKTQATFPFGTNIYLPQDTNEGIRDPTIYIMVKYERVSRTSSTPVLTRILVEHFKGKVSKCVMPSGFSLESKIKTIESYNSEYENLLAGHPGTVGSCWYIGGCAVFTPINLATSIVDCVTLTATKNSGPITDKIFKYSIYDTNFKHDSRRYELSLDNIEKMDLHTKCKDDFAGYLVYGNINIPNDYVIDGVVKQNILPDNTFEELNTYLVVSNSSSFSSYGNGNDTTTNTKANDPDYCGDDGTGKSAFCAVGKQCIANVCKIPGSGYMNLQTGLAQQFINIVNKEIPGILETILSSTGIYDSGSKRIYGTYSLPSPAEDLSFTVFPLLSSSSTPNPVVELKLEGLKSNKLKLNLSLGRILANLKIDLELSHVWIQIDFDAINIPITLNMKLPASNDSKSGYISDISYMLPPKSIYGNSSDNLNVYNSPNFFNLYQKYYEDSNIIMGGKYTIRTSNSDLFLNTSYYIKLSSTPTIFTIYDNGDGTISFHNSEGDVNVFYLTNAKAGSEVIDKSDKSYNETKFYLIDNKNGTYSISPATNKNLFVTTSNAGGYGTRLYPNTLPISQGNQKYIFTRALDQSVWSHKISGSGLGEYVKQNAGYGTNPQSLITMKEFLNNCDISIDDVDGTIDNILGKIKDALNVSVSDEIYAYLIVGGILAGILILLLGLFLSPLIPILGGYIGGVEAEKVMSSEIENLVGNFLKNPTNPDITSFLNSILRPLLKDLFSQVNSIYLINMISGFL